MKIFFSNIWKYLTFIIAGVVGGLILAMKQLKPTQNINTDQYIGEQSQETRIGKIKQKGENLNMKTFLPDNEILTPRQIRRNRRAERREARKATAFEKETEKEELEQKDY